MLHFVSPISCASIIAWMVVMTLAIAFKGSEGVVLAADSRVTLPVAIKEPNTGKDWLVPATYDNATKLLKIAGQDHVVAVTYGLGTLGSPELSGLSMPPFNAWRRAKA